MSNNFLSFEHLMKQFDFIFWKKKDFGSIQWAGKDSFNERSR